VTAHPLCDPVVDTNDRLSISDRLSHYVKKGLKSLDIADKQLYNSSRKYSQRSDEWACAEVA